MFHQWMPEGKASLILINCEHAKAIASKVSGSSGVLKLCCAISAVEAVFSSTGPDWL